MSKLSETLFGKSKKKKEKTKYEKWIEANNPEDIDYEMVEPKTVITMDSGIEIKLYDNGLQ